MTYFLTDRIPAFALLLGLMAVPAWADDDKNESGKGNKRSAEAHQRDGERRAINPRDSLGSKESLEGHNRRSHEPGDRTYEDRRMREHREARENRRNREDRSQKDDKDRWKDSEKHAKETRKADEEWNKHAEKREKDWRKREEEWHKESSKRWGDDRRRHGGHDYFNEHHTQLRIPNGHLPPTGECRIWYPDRPAGHQPPPGRCTQLSAQVPAGAWLIQRPGGTHRYYVNAYDAQQPGVILDRAAYDLRGGVLVLIAHIP